MFQRQLQACPKLRGDFEELAEEALLLLLSGNQPPPGSLYFEPIEIEAYPKAGIGGDQTVLSWIKAFAIDYSKSSR
jgi:hypothetical protein